MNIYTICALCIVGAIARLSHFQSVQTLNNVGLSIKHHDLITKEEVRKNAIGAFIGTLLLVSSLIFSVINHRDWTLIIYLIVSFLICLFILKLSEATLGRSFSRIIFIWVLPIIGSIYFITKIV